MNTVHYEFWPKRLPKTLDVPETSLYENLAISAKKYPKKVALYYYGAKYTYEEIFRKVEALAGYLENKLGVVKGDNVLLLMQNSPQFLISYYAILRVRAVVVPINPMSTSEDLSFFINDGSIRFSLIGDEQHSKIAELKKTTCLEKIVIASYSDYAGDEKEYGKFPNTEVRKTSEVSEDVLWKEALEMKLEPSVFKGNSEDVVALPYTSGTTGIPKGCIHTNSTVQANTIGAYQWFNMTSSTINLLSLPLFHVTGMTHSMHAPLYVGGTIVMMTRWDRNYAMEAIEKYRCTNWINITTMVIDFLSHPKLSEYQLSSLKLIGGGGASLPVAVGERLTEVTGLEYVEGYGLTETMSHTHFNPPDRPKLQCLGIPSMDVDARVINPNEGTEVASGEEGELVVNGKQVMKGYYNREEDNRSSFIEIDGKSFFRTGDIVRVDNEGYFFLVDRVKRMINAAGFKVWPTEIESQLYKHPAIQQACVIGIPDVRRGETVKAFVILNESFVGKITEEEVIQWAKERMAAYKYPRFIEFRERLPLTSSGKILWRKLQEENDRLQS
ncbi:long-chain-fatty-acid--CoA ligase [Sporosarcina sp. CAU 1771]